MFIVAVTRWASSPEQEAQWFAPLLGVTAYDLKLQMLGPPPVLLTGDASMEEASALLGQLRERGHGAVACDADQIPGPEDILFPRSFEFERKAFVAVDENGWRYPLEYGQIIGVLRATAVTSEEHTVMTTERKPNLGRAALTGGVLRHASSEKTRVKTRDTRQDTLYVFRNAGPAPMVLVEGGLDYSGLGEARGATHRANWELTVRTLRERTRHAIYDDQLARQKRRPRLQQISGGSRDRTVEHSNIADNDLAAYILMHAHLQSQV